MEHWYRFSIDGGKLLYGRGTLEQALRYAERLRARNAGCTTRGLSDEEAKELRLEDSTEAFSLTRTLAEAG
jgi:hypothetical protein